MADRDLIVCRARVDADCMHGRDGRRSELNEAMEGEDDDWRDDGTYRVGLIDPTDLTSVGESIVCDACYVALMPYSATRQLLNAEIPGAIRAYREMHPTIPGTT